MNVLVIGSGGREHAIVKGLSNSNLIHKIYCAPGNAGIGQLAENVEIDIKNHSALLSFCKKNLIEFAFVGPEDPLVAGVADALRSQKILVFGPSRDAAQLEGSKIFAKSFMESAKVPTARASVVSSVSETLKAAEQYSAPYILKADGLAAGKGVFICQNLSDLEAAASELFVKKSLGVAGSKALLEQNLPGYEISFLVLTNGKDYTSLPLAQDHKRLKDNDKGPNTGGMGTTAPMKVSPELFNKIIERVVAPSINELEIRNLDFRGVLFIGLMIVNEEPYVLEYNVRFGDPETQVILPLIENDLGELFVEIAKGRVIPIVTNQKHAVCIVNAAEGYPEKPIRGRFIELPKSGEENYILHAGTSFDQNGRLVSSGGRVLNVLGVASNLDRALEAANELNSKIIFENRQFRTDIGRFSKTRVKAP